MELGLQDRVYIITGGTRGLGFATAAALVDEGARVVVVGRNSADVKHAQAALGTACLGMSGDLGDPQCPELAIANDMARFNRVDGALISVGGPAPGTVLDRTDADWESAFGSIFLGTVRFARRIAQHLLDADVPGGESGVNGVIGIVLSVSVRQSIPGLTLSNALRPGLAMVVSDLADEVGPQGIRTFGLLPGRIATERTQQLDEATGDSAGARARAEAMIALRRYGTPREFGDCAAFLLSPRASYITGTCLAVDGGLLRMA
ncbi:MAG: SDR family oxidoreductase [Actinomycetales bacterium]